MSAARDPRIDALIDRLLPPSERPDVRAALDLCHDFGTLEVERAQLSILKLVVEASMTLSRAVQLGATDCRDLFLAAGFPYGSDARDWLAKQFEPPSNVG